MKHLLLVDLGGSSLKVGLYQLDGESVEVVSEANKFDEDATGKAEQNPEEWWQALQSATEKLYHRGTVAFLQIAAVVICGFTRTQVFLDAKAHPIRPAMVFRDSRANVLVKKLRDQKFGNQLSAHFNPFHPLARLLWLREHEDENWNLLAHVIEPKDYLNFKLSGQIFSDPISQFWSLDDAKQGTGCQESSLWERTGLVRGEFVPRLRMPHEQVGTVQSGLPGALAQIAGAKIFCGAPDTWTAAYGLRALRAGCGYGISGSSEVFGLISDVEAQTQGLVTIPWGEGLWQIGGPGQNGANVLSWIVHNLDDTPRPFAQKLEHLWALQTGQPLLFYPFLHGERTPFWDEKLRASFLGLTSTHRSGDMVRAVMEGVAFINRMVLERAEAAAGVKAQEIRLGGGGSYNMFWNQIRANILGRPIFVAKSSQMGLMGAYAIACKGLNLADSEQETEKILKKQFEMIVPQPEKSPMYEELYHIFCASLPAFEQISHRLANLQRSSP